MLARDVGEDPRVLAFSCRAIIPRILKQGLQICPTELCLCMSELEATSMQSEGAE